ncbi:acetyl-CoA synthetase-like protein [Podospora appendiculata]|uniref:Acetyl-CoA synthetase-like protein n=1 Tax=Podospora appendiculata TaxID=314037 RepID=A0AAE1CGT3_9PEZI|nr:acetyl-CoA synthetase-like protein [Podospora appendiculata]
MATVLPSYTDLQQQQQQQERNLTASGDRVAVSLGNCPEFAALTYAIFKLGAILVPLNPGFNGKQVAAALNHLGVGVLIIGAVRDLAYKPAHGRSNIPLLSEIIPDLLSSRLEAPHVPTLSKVIVVDNSASHPSVAFPVLHHLSALTPFSSLTRDARPGSTSSRPVIPDSPLSPSETINIQFTSGTTAHPKAAMLSHTSILNNGALIANRMGLEPSDRIVCPPPLFHCFGSVLGYMATATTGAAILFPSPAFDPLASLKMAADHRATGLYGVATMFVAMLELVASQAQSPKPDIPLSQLQAFPEHLRKGIAAGSSVPESLMRRLYDTLGLRDLVICYGMTETSPVSLMTAPSDPFDKRTGSIGKAMPHTRVKVVDPADRTKVLPIGERGELATAGYLVMKGYWGDEERTKEVRISEPNDDGRGSTVWMYSGDEARMDADGYVEITGRIKDLIIRGGENIHPLEIENCLFQHPLIAEASVVGVPHERYGECVGAFVIAHEDVEVVEDEAAAVAAAEGGRVLTKAAVREWVRTHLSDHLVPKHVFWVRDFPETASGKIQKYKLREMAKHALEAAGLHRDDDVERKRGSMKLTVAVLAFASAALAAVANMSKVSNTSDASYGPGGGYGGGGGGPSSHKGWKYCKEDSESGDLYWVYGTCPPYSLCVETVVNIPTVVLETNITATSLDAVSCQEKQLILQGIFDDLSLF